MPNGYIGQIHVNQTDYKIGSTLFTILDNTDPQKGSIDTENGITTFTVPLDGYDTLAYGVTIHIQFKQAWTNSENLTAWLKVGNTASRPIINPNGAITWGANSVISFTYDGSSYVMNTVGFDASNVTIDVSKLSNLTLGNIQSTGALQTGADVAIKGGDKLVITDSGDGNKIARSSLEFSVSIDTQSQDTRFLREDGSWAAPSYTTDTNTNRSIKIDGEEKLSSSSSTPLDLIGGRGIAISENNGEVTIANTFIASDLGLSSALRFIGVTTTDMHDGYKGPSPGGIPGYTSPQVGDVVIHGDEEYVYVKKEDSTEENTTYYEWELLGRDSSFALNTEVIKRSDFTNAYQLIYSSATNTPAFLAPNTSDTTKYLSMQGDGINGGTPIWLEINKTTLGLGNVTNHAQVYEVEWDNDNKKITYTKNNEKANVVTFSSEGNITLTADTNGLNISASNFTGATALTSGKAGNVPAPTRGSEAKFLQGSGSWKTLSIPIIASVNNGVLEINNVALSVT